jgi:hypothetical protein
MLEIRKDGRCFSVVNVDSGHVYGKCSTKKAAESQMRLLHGIESGWKPTRKPKKTAMAGTEDKVQIVNEQPIAEVEMEKPQLVEVGMGTKKKCGGGKKCGTGKNTTKKCGMGAGTWKAFVSKALAGKKFGSRDEANKAMKELSAQWKSSKSGAGNTELLLSDGLGSGEKVGVTPI